VEWLKEKECEINVYCAFNTYTLRHPPPVCVFVGVNLHKSCHLPSALCAPCAPCVPTCVHFSWMGKLHFPPRQENGAEMLIS